MAPIGPRPNESTFSCAVSRPVSAVVPSAPPPAMSMADMPAYAWNSAASRLAQWAEANLVNRTDDYNVVLQDANLENQAGKLFIVGEFAAGTTSGDWAPGVPTAVSWDNVEQYLVFDTIEDYFTRMSLGWNDRTMQ